MTHARPGGLSILGVLAVAVLLCGCEQAEPPGAPAGSGATPPPSATSSALPPRPAPAATVAAATRSPASSASGTVPIWGAASGIVIDPVVGQAYVSTGGSLQVLDLGSRTAVDEVDVAGSSPGVYPSVAVDPYAGLLYATRALGAPAGSISMIETLSHRVRGSFRVGTRDLWRITVDPTSGRVYVLEEGGGDATTSHLLVVDGTTHEVLDRVAVPADPVSDLAVDPVRGRVLVADDRYGKLVVVDLAGPRVQRTIQVVPGMDDPCENCLGYLGMPVVDPGTGLVYVSGPTGVGRASASQALDQGAGALVPLDTASRAATVAPVGGGGSAVYVVDPAAGTVLRSISTPAMVLWTGAIDPAAGVVYLTTAGPGGSGVQALQTRTLDLGAVVPVPGVETHLALDPRSGAVWVAGDGLVTILE